MKFPDVLWILRYKVLSRPVPYEPGVMNRLKMVRGDLFVDVGANVGVYSKKLRKNFKRIVSIEPSPDYYQMLLDRVGGFADIKTCALSNFNGETRFFLKHSDILGSGDSLLERWRYNPSNGVSEDIINSDSVEVYARTFDSLFPGEVVDLVKIDVEGAEFLVLAGMSDALKNKRIKHLVVELHDCLKRNNLLSLFQLYNYKSEWLDSEHLFASVI